MYLFYVYKYTPKVLEEYTSLEKGLYVKKVINRDIVLYLIYCYRFLAWID